MYFKLILAVVFLSLNFAVYYITEKNNQDKIDYAKFHYLNKLQLNYEAFLTFQLTQANLIYETTLNEEMLVDTISKAWNTADVKQRDILREKLFNALYPNYQKIKETGILQYHFVFPDNTSFLRMHKPDKYGDNLSSVRLDFAKVNTRKEIVRGFSQGRTAHALRNVFPIFDANKKHIGAFEVSFTSEYLQDNLYHISEIYSHFIVDKAVFDTKMWERNDRVVQYIQSYEGDDYLLSLTNIENKKYLAKIKPVIAQLKEEIKLGLNKELMFSLVSKKVDGEHLIIAFYPIYQNVTSEVSAWLVSYNNAPELTPIIKESNYIRVIAFLILSLLFYFFYKTTKQKNTLATLNKSYDENVIFSITGLSGRIVHASKAFCKISEYTLDELIGQPHSIVRHEDMPKKAFQEMWETIQSGKVWRGEVKNAKKNGGFYWVDAKIEPIYNESQKCIGYSATRHDITVQKEIEDIQKEIIFTMGSIGESRSRETANHVRRVAEYSRILASEYGLNKEECEMLKQASPMHDIGKVAIPDAILNKPSKLTSDEMQIMKSHASIGYSMLSSSNRPLLKIASTVALEHHENWDGTGYPNQIKGEGIHIYGRITALADVFDALGSRRCYKEAWEDEKLLEYIKSESGKKFDPRLVEILLEKLDLFLVVRETFKD